MPVKIMLDDRCTSAAKHVTAANGDPRLGLALDFLRPTA
jgi:hypothetical protein